MCMLLGSIELMCTLWAYIYVAFCIYLLSVYIVCVCLHVCISIYIMVNVLCSQSIAICTIYDFHKTEVMQARDVCQCTECTHAPCVFSLAELYSSETVLGCGLNALTICV